MAKTAKQQGLDQWAKDFGYQLAFLKSDPELYALFQKAVKEGWDPNSNTFAVALQKTKWWRTHGETYRQNLAQSKVDPGTFQDRVAQKFADLADLSQQMGGTGSGSIISRLAHDAVLFGWSDAQIRNQLAAYVKITGGRAQGQAGDTVQALRQTAWRNGVKVSDNWLQTQARSIAAGNMTLEDAQRTLREQYAKSLAPGFAKELSSGMDLYDIASPYIQSMASTLELNPTDIDLFDPTIRNALNAKGPDGKPGGTQTLYDFEQGLRNDKRWLKTKQAQDQTMTVAHQVLSDMGLGF